MKIIFIRLYTLLFFGSTPTVFYANSAYTELVYDPSKTYSVGDAVIPSATNPTLYTAKTLVPSGGGNEPPNSAYWMTAEEMSSNLDNTHSDTVSTPPRTDNIDTTEIPGSISPESNDNFKTLVLNALEGGSVSGAGDFDENATVQILATPNPGYIFSAWSGDFSSNDASVTIVLRANYTMTASFAQDNRDDDGDSLTNYQEAVIYNTSTTNSDSDSDGINDGDEVNLGSNPAVSDSGLISYFNNQIDSEKLNSYNYGYSDGKISGQLEVIDEIVKVVTSVATANGLNISDELRSYSYTDFFTIVGTLNLSNIQLVIEQFIDYWDIEISPYTEGWFFSPLQGWMWTDKSVYPYFFKQEFGWIYFKRGKNIPTFYNFETESWFDLNEFNKQ